MCRIRTRHRQQTFACINGSKLRGTNNRDRLDLSIRIPIGQWTNMFELFSMLFFIENYGWFQLLMFSDWCDIDSMTLRNKMACFKSSDIDIYNIYVCIMYYASHFSPWMVNIPYAVARSAYSSQWMWAEWFIRIMSEQFEHGSTFQRSSFSFHLELSFRMN